MLVLEYLLNLLRVAPVVSALLFIAGANTRRPHRVQQTWVPVIAIVFALAALIVLYRSNDAIDAWLAAFASAIPFGPSSLGTPWLYIAENTLLLLAFLLVKLAVRPVFRRFFADGKESAQFAVARIYEYDDEFELWFVERRHSRLRDFYRILYWISVCLTVLLIASALTFPGWPGFSAIAFPALAAMIIGEFFFAIDGVTKDEFAHSLYGERDVARRLGNFGPLRGVLRETFPTRILAEGVHLSSIAALDSGFRVGEMTRSPDVNTRLAGAYFERLRQQGKDVDVNLARSSADLMAGSNVLYLNPFYADLTPYLALPAYRELLEGRRCLVIAGRDSLADDLAEWIAQGLEDISGVPKLWKVRQLDGVSKERADVGVFKSSDLHNLEVLRNNDEFFRDVGLIILAEPARTLATGQLGLELVLDRCTQDGPVAVAAFDGNHDGLVDTLSHLTKASLTEVVASPLPQGASSELVWDADGPRMQGAILPGVSRYLGVGTEISAVAMKFQVSRVHWVGGDTFPVVDMRWIAQQYFASINQFANLELSQDALADSLVAVPNPWGLVQSDNYFLVVEDEVNNAYETIRRFSTRATRSGFVNLISGDYLLRDYMVANRGVFAADAKAIPSIVPDYARTERNVMLRLLLALRGFGMTASQIEKQLDLPSWMAASDPPSSTYEGTGVEPAAIQALRAVIARHAGADDAPLTASGAAALGLAIASDDDPTYRLRSGSPIIDATIRNLGPAYFFVEDDLDAHNVIGSLLVDHVYQAMLPGQFVSYGGKYYEVQGIRHDDVQSRVILRRAADHIHDRYSYRQLRSYSISAIRPADEIGAVECVGDIRIFRAVADFDAETLGYLECRSRSDIESSRRVAVTGVPARRHSNKAVLVLALPGASHQVRQTLAVLLNELFVTVFPHGHQYVVAVTATTDGVAPELLASLELPEEAGSVEQPWHESIFILEDSTIDLGLTSAVERHWERLFDIVTDYLAWNETTDSPPSRGAASDDVDPDIEDPVLLFPKRPAAVAPEESHFLGSIKSRLGRRGVARQPTAMPPASSDRTSQDPTEADTAREDFDLEDDAQEGSVSVEGEAADPGPEERALETPDASHGEERSREQK